MHSLTLSLVGKSDGHCVPGVETKLSAWLSVGEFSNLMRGVDMMLPVLSFYCAIQYLTLIGLLGYCRRQFESRPQLM